MQWSGLCKSKGVTSLCILLLNMDFDGAGAPLAEQCTLEVFLEGLVPYAVDERAQHPGQQVGHHKAAKEHLGGQQWEHADQDPVEHRADVGQHAEQQLGGVQQYGALGLLGLTL